MANQIKKKYIANDAIDGQKILLEEGQTLRRIENGSEVDVIQSLQDAISSEESSRLAVDTKILDSIKKEVLFETEAQIMGVAPDAGVPISNPNDASDEGWYFDKSLPGAENKINWYFHYKSQAPVHLDESNLSVYFTSAVEAGYIFLGVYTSPEGDGSDASSWYRSRLVLSYDLAQVNLNQEYLFWAFNEPSADIRPELTRIELTPRVSSMQRGPAGTAFLADGTRLAEMLDRVAVNTDSGDSSTIVRVYDAGIQGEKYEKEIAFRIKDRVTLDDVMSLSLQKNSMNAQRSEYLKLYSDYMDSLLQAGITGEATAREAGDTATLNSAKAYTDSQIASIPSVDLSGIESDIQDLQGADESLQQQIDSILSNTDPASIDSLSEVVTAFENADNNLNQAITDLASNIKGDLTDATHTSIEELDDALAQEVSDRTSADSALSSRVDALEAVSFEKENFVLSATDIANGYIDLANEAIVKSVRFYVGRLAGFEGEDYELSVVGGVTRITFIGSFASGGSEAMAEGDKVKVAYSHTAV